MDINCAFLRIIKGEAAKGLLSVSNHVHHFNCTVCFFLLPSLENVLIGFLRERGRGGREKRQCEREPAVALLCTPRAVTEPTTPPCTGQCSD